MSILFHTPTHYYATGPSQYNNADIKTSNCINQNIVALSKSHIDQWNRIRKQETDPH